MSSGAFNALRGHARPGDRLELMLTDAPHLLQGVLLELHEDGLLLKDPDLVWVPGQELRAFRVTAGPEPPLTGQAPEEPPPTTLSAPEPPTNLRVRLHPGPRAPEKQVLDPPTSGAGLPDFSPPPVLELPPPELELEAFSPDDRNELVLFRNRCDHWLARKPWKLRPDISAMARVAERSKSAALFEQLGWLAANLQEPVEARKLYMAGLRLGHGDCGVRLAALCIGQESYRDAAHSLVLGLGRPTSPACPAHQLLESLGRCLHRSESREIPGLAQALKAYLNSEELAWKILAFSVTESNPEAARKLLAKDLEKARELLGKSPIFWTPQIGPPPEAPSPMPGALIGRITAYYPDRQYGFAVDESQKRTYYFHLNRILSQPLAAQLEQGIVGQRVALTRTHYDRMAPPKYLPVEITMLLDLSLSSVSQRPLLTARKPGPLPRVGGAYRQAKLAEQRGDWQAAQQAYREEVAQDGPYKRAAIMDCAALLNRLEDYDSALRLLENHRPAFAETRPLDNLKLQILIKSQRYDQAEQLLKVLAGQEGGQKKRNLIMQRAYCLYAANRLDEASRVLQNLLKSHPWDPAIKDLLEKCKQARTLEKTPRTTLDEEITVQFTNLTLGQLSPFARFILRNCEYRGVDDRSRNQGFYTAEDFNAVDRLLGSIKGRRPRDKAEYLLTMAAIADQCPEVGEDTRELLHRCFTFQGESSMHESLHSDVARCYLTEAVNLARERSVDRPLGYLLATYYSQAITPGELLDEHGNVRTTAVLRRFQSDQQGWERLVLDLPYIAMRSTEGIQRLLKEVRNLPGLALDPPTIDRQRREEMDRVRKEETELKALTDRPSSAAGLTTSTQTLLRLAETTRFELDRQRLRTLGSLFGEASVYWTETDYLEKESRCSRLQHELGQFCLEVRACPTRLSVESLWDIAQSLQNQLENDFREFAGRSKPALELANLLDEDYYVPDREGAIELALEVRSRIGSAPVEGLDVLVEESDGLVMLDPAHSPAVLRGGERREVRARVRPSPAQLADQAFAVSATVRFRTRSGQQMATEEFSLPVRIGTPESFQPVSNPYAAYSGGTVVEEPAMFFGRTDLIGRIQDQVVRGPVGQCFVLYGQKRSGKSSVLRQLKRLITPPNLCVDFALGLLDTRDCPEGNFARLLVDSLEDRLLEVLGDRPADWPAIQEVVARPLDSIRTALRASTRFMEGRGYSSPRLILLIDEFTYLFEYIREGMLPHAFMRHWKALLEQKLFSSVVVGQDSMPRFKQAYPNEFGVTHDERITYLSDAEARALAEKPILLDTRSRYRGKALERVLQETAGSPFYLQIFCDHLVRHLNERRAPFITEADVDAVAGHLQEGPRALPIERFDPLITAAGESVAEAARERYLELLAAIANHSSLDSGAWPADLPEMPDRERLLRDLQEREVTTCDASGRVSIRVTLFAGWLRKNPVLAGAV